MTAAKSSPSGPSPAPPRVALRRGVFITFEGPDGCGKTTVARACAAALQARGYAPVAVLREPGQSSAGKRIRERNRAGGEGLSLEEEIDLFIQDRRWDLETNIRPVLEQRGVVLLDRYYHSSIAYQGARGGDVAEIRRRNEAFAPAPDLIVLLQLDVETCLERICGARGGEPDLFEQRERLERVLQIFEAMSDPQIRRFDASLPPEALQEQVLAAVTATLAAHHC